MAIMITCRICRGLTPETASPNCLHCEARLVSPPVWARRLAWVFGPAGAILLAACYGPAGRYRHDDKMQDNDGDGAATVRCDKAADVAGCEAAAKADPKLDCDDNDANSFPGALDLTGDGIDQNCDGQDGAKKPAATP